jgi:hypothetical protein
MRPAPLTALRPSRPAALALTLLAALFVGACGEDVQLDGDASQVGDDDDDSDGGGPDGVIGCSASADLPECSNGCDDDGDGDVDGWDIECTGSADDDESSFATNIPGDNQDDRQQDCFFDGNSGSGGGDCQYYTCCLLDDPTTGDIECGDPALGLQHPGYVSPTESCDNADSCQTYCADLAPPGCDCFGCCTICADNPATPGAEQECVDIAINPAISPTCDDSAVFDPARCTPCVQNTECGGGACQTGGDDCILCPGEDPSSLPESCGGTSACPDGTPPCSTTDDCAANQFCASGCCIAVIS